MHTLPKINKSSVTFSLLVCFSIAIGCGPMTPIAEEENTQVDGTMDGNVNGQSDGNADGNSTGGSDGTADGSSIGETDGSSDGNNDGNTDGFPVFTDAPVDEDCIDGLYTEALPTPTTK